MKPTVKFVIATVVIGGLLMIFRRPATDQNNYSPPPPVYFCTLNAYREHRIQDEIEEANNNGGDRFEEEAARKRILSIPDAKLDAQRKSDLAFVVKAYKDAGKPDFCQ